MGKEFLGIISAAQKQETVDMDVAVLQETKTMDPVFASHNFGWGPFWLRLRIVKGGGELHFWFGRMAFLWWI